MPLDTATSENELILNLSLGNPSAFDLLFDRYWQYMYEVAFQRLGDEEQAKDVVQNVFSDLWEKHAGLKITTSLQPYLYGAVKLKVLQHFRSEKIKKRVFDNALEHLNLLISESDELSGYYELEKLISTEVKEMPDNMKQVFLLRSQQYSVKEIARTLNLAEQTVANNMTEAMKRLRSRLKGAYADRYLLCLASVCTALMYN
ncbi:sigma-70 family RNA polymerase sigma factor [Mucilaginibacter sp. RS28]|uniref:Sigma-70 family RNA polymerase sigma factor n=1 Tax=Mucilaginibacter straminoryzae TaxID=2932774 RepID=A0A9X1X3U3_9SPHI|nr:sigma-70 family RNA polymerase sigma factor [Mucilaginibacter straminoryzae]MCJ8209143.1 sigma-70 family RNA polymerase sigma factor [Mucilaginibacter straminoryzae]